MQAKLKHTIESLLNSAKLRLTGPRAAILAVLLGADKPLRQDQIAVKLGAEAPDKVTIYRTLETFLDSGIVHRAFLRERACISNLRTTALQVNVTRTLPAQTVVIHIVWSMFQSHWLRH